MSQFREKDCLSARGKAATRKNLWRRAWHVWQTAGLLANMKRFWVEWKEDLGSFCSGKSKKRSYTPCHGTLAWQWHLEDSGQALMISTWKPNSYAIASGGYTIGRWRWTGGGVMVIRQGLHFEFMYCIYHGLRDLLFWNVGLAFEPVKFCVNQFLNTQQSWRAERSQYHWTPNSMFHMGINY